MACLSWNQLAKVSESSKSGALLPLDRISLWQERVQESETHGKRGGAEGPGTKCLHPKGTTPPVRSHLLRFSEPPKIVHHLATKCLSHEPMGNILCSNVTRAKYMSQCLRQGQLLREPKSQGPVSQFKPSLLALETQRTVGKSPSRLQRNFL